LLFGWILYDILPAKKYWLCYTNLLRIRQEIKKFVRDLLTFLNNLFSFSLRFIREKDSLPQIHIDETQHLVG
jgi:hypothetical protein